MMDSDFLYLVEAELANAREDTPTPVNSQHEAYGMICGGTARLLNAMQGRPGAKAAILRELVQIAAMCYRAAEDLQLVGVRPEPEPVPHQWCQEHQGKRFRADDSNQEKLGMAVNYKCLHGVEWTVTGACLDALRLEQFNHCDCPVKELCSRDYCRHDIDDHGLFNGCKMPGCACWQFCRLEVQIASQR